MADFLISLNLSPDDEVAISSFSCLAVPTAVVAAGLKPAYYDINPETMNISMETIAPVLTSKTRVIIVQHTLGSIFEIDQMIKWAHQKDIILVEDCALSIGKTAKGQIVGGRGDAAIFSMELSKILSSGWGGVLVINNSKFIDTMSELLYAKGNIVEAVKTIREAISLDPKNSYYKQQIWKFKNIPHNQN